MPSAPAHAGDAVVRRPFNAGRSRGCSARSGRTAPWPRFSRRPKRRRPTDHCPSNGGRSGGAGYDRPHTRMSQSATYVYCVTRSAARPSTARVPSGLPGATRPSPVPLQRSLWLITADVPLQAYGPQALEPALRDIQWVADIAVAHEAVVEHFTRQRGATVVPMKLFTMFSSVERAVDEM